jgi:N-dimethylarginine dimethylaminohydrolase
MYGDVSKNFAEKVSSLGIEVKYGEFERGAFISNGEVGFITVKNNLRKYPELLKECGELYEFSRLNCHIDSFVNFLNRELFVVNRSCIQNLAKKIEYRLCDFSAIDEIVNILKRKGYNPIKINEYYEDSSCIVGNFLNLGNNKIVVIDNKNHFSKKLERGGVDVINLYEEESFEHLLGLQAGLRCITLPIKRDY